MALKHKHLRLDQAKLDRVRRLLGAPTECDAVDQALDLVLAERTIRRAHRRGKKVGGFEEVFS